MGLLKQRAVTGILVFLSCCFMICVAVFTPGTGDSGDSINHYLHSRYAFDHPLIFLDLWNKPVFTLLTAPFAQAGFTGIKIFNALCGALSLWVLVKMARLYSRENDFLAVILFLGSAFHLVVLNSGLTEPLFDALLILSLYLIARDKKVSASILLSLLPFVRQEGYLLLVFFMLYFLIKKEFRNLALLFAGHLVVSLAGVFHHGDILWVLKNNPNAMMGHYGHGGWFDYFHKLAFIFGKPVYIFIALGMLAFIIGFWKVNSRMRHLMLPSHLPLYCFLVVVLSHVVFWRFGLFKSFGMDRNILSVFSCGVIVAYTGLAFLIHKIKNGRLGIAVISVICAGILIYPFFPGKHDVVFRRDLALQPDQVMIKQLMDSIRPQFTDHKLYTSHPHALLASGVDPFDPSLSGNLVHFHKRENRKEKVMVIWDNWFAVMEGGISLESLQSDSTLVIAGSRGNEKYQVQVFISR